MDGLEVRGLCKRYGESAVLDGIDADFPPGCVTAVLGPNGAGKSTLLKVLGGVLPSTAAVCGRAQTARVLQARLARFDWASGLFIRKAH